MKIINFFFFFYQALYEIVLGVKVSVVGFPGKQDEQSLIIMNHRTRLDWLFAYSFMLRCGSLRHLKIVLKSGLKKIPGAGKLYIYIFSNQILSFILTIICFLSIFFVYFFINKSSYTRNSSKSTK